MRSKHFEHFNLGNRHFFFMYIFFLIANCIVISATDLHEQPLIRSTVENKDNPYNTSRWLQQEYNQNNLYNVSITGENDTDAVALAYGIMFEIHVSVSSDVDDDETLDDALDDASVVLRKVKLLLETLDEYVEIMIYTRRGSLKYLRHPGAWELMTEEGVKIKTRNDGILTVVTENEMQPIHIDNDSILSIYITCKERIMFTTYLNPVINQSDWSKDVTLLPSPFGIALTRVWQKSILLRTLNMLVVLLAT